MRSAPLPRAPRVRGCITCVVKRLRSFLTMVQRANVARFTCVHARRDAATGRIGIYCAYAATTRLPPPDCPFKPLTRPRFTPFRNAYTPAVRACWTDAGARAPSHTITWCTLAATATFHRHRLYHYLPRCYACLLRFLPLVCGITTRQPAVRYNAVYCQLPLPRTHA